ncbi:tyrosine/serine/threonine protein phosphatase pps1 [Elasticomyces elasticus]|nr:tyrosine/serine/threonine protein phosphatase pps1 [Elasticomyces elasticus]
MATIMAPRPTALPNSRHSTPPPHLSINTFSHGTPTAVPNKHIPICSPGPRPNSGLETPPASPPSATVLEAASLLHPPDRYRCIFEEPPLYELSASELAQALDYASTQPLPEAHQVFPWLHGLHGSNQLQLAFFVARRKVLRQTPSCIRGITIVKARGDLSHSRLKGAIAPEELLCTISESEEVADFREVDPKEGFSVRNFHIQARKMATVSDVVVYGDERTSREEVDTLAKRIARAQRNWRAREGGAAEFNTFVVTEPFSSFERQYQELVALDSNGFLTGSVMDFFHSERVEMCTMSKASEIINNVYLGPTPDPTLVSYDDSDEPRWDIMVEALDLAHVPGPGAFSFMDDLIDNPGKCFAGSIPQLEFPGSGGILPPIRSHREVDALLETCAWIHRQANGLSERSRQRKDSKVQITPPLRQPIFQGSDTEVDGDGDDFMFSPDSLTPMSTGDTGRKILIHCADGYTETSLLGLAYLMYAEGLPVHDAWLRLHTQKKRNFFAYPADVALLTAIQPRILQASPALVSLSSPSRSPMSYLHCESPNWLRNFDGSLPSRILAHMYLGNLSHANNSELLCELGIGQVLSIGEPVSWSEEVKSVWGRDKLMFIEQVQDNGVDPLTGEFEKCLSFIEKGREAGTATLVHCRVGVSRSATICIAEVMDKLELSFPKA